MMTTLVKNPRQPQVSALYAGISPGKSASGKFGASSPLRLPHLPSLAVDFRE